MPVIPTNLTDLSLAQVVEFTGQLSALSPTAVTELRNLAAAEYNTSIEAARADRAGTTTEQIDRMYALREFVQTADELLGGDPADEPVGGDDAARLDQLSPVDVNAPAGAPAPVTSGGDGTVEPPPTVADIAGNPLVTQQSLDAVNATLAQSAITASVGLSGITPGEAVTLEQLGDALTPRIIGYLGMSGGSSSDPFARVTLPSTEFTSYGDRRDIEVVRSLVDESRMSGGSLVAARMAAFEATGSLEALTASGWCAQSEIDRTVRFGGMAAGLVDLPTITATRGGVWIVPELTFADVYGVGGANYFSFTEAEIIAGAVKSFVTLDCPTPVEYRLGVTGFGLIAGLLQLRAYPEYTREYVRASLIGLQHFRSAANIAAMVAGSTAVNLTAIAPWSNDGSVLSQVLAAAEMAAVDQRYRFRMERTATIEQVFPIWVLSQMRADFLRRNGTGGDPSLADAWVMRWFADKYIAPQFVYGWQDFYSAGGTTPGAATPITAFPTSLQFLSYPAGTWVNAIADVIQLSTVYDSTRLASNERIEFFTEQGNRMIPRLSGSRVYTIGICPNGSTGVQRAVACA